MRVSKRFSYIWGAIVFVFLLSVKINSYAYSCETEESALNSIRTHMVNREENFSVNVSPEVSQILMGSNYDIFEKVYEYTPNPKEGDYLKSSTTRFYFPEYLDDNLVFHCEYRTTASEESYVSQRVSEIIESLGVKNSSLSDYEKIATIYDYVVWNVSYDYEAFETLGKSNPKCFTAFAAINDKKAVCEGIAQLLYRLLNEVGIECRIVTNEGDINIPESNLHSWNVVKLGGKYYFLDATSDLGYGPYGWNYFLVGKYDYNNRMKDLDSGSIDYVYSIDFFEEKYGEEITIENKQYSLTGYPYIMGHGLTWKVKLLNANGQNTEIDVNDGRRKILIFSNEDCGFGDIILDRLNKAELFSDIDIYYLDIYDKNTYKLLRTMYGESQTMTVWDYTPSTFVINKRNEIVLAFTGVLPSDSFGYLINSSLKKSEDNSVFNSKVDESHIHEYEFLSYRIRPTENECGYADYQCKSCGKHCVELIPTLKGNIKNQCGDNAFWNFNVDSRILTIYGIGATWDNFNFPSPVGMCNTYDEAVSFFIEDDTSVSSRGAVNSKYYLYESNVEKIVIEEGITWIGGSFFEQGFCNVESIEFPNSLKGGGNGAYSACDSIGRDSEELRLIFRGKFPSLAQPLSLYRGKSAILEYPLNDESWNDLSIASLSMNSIILPNIDEIKTRGFVSRLYNECLQRQAEDNGLDFWTQELLNKCKDGASVAAGFIFSPEFWDKGLTRVDYLKVLYNVFFDREYDEEGLQYWKAQMRNGLTREDVFKFFVESQEFSEVCEEYGIERGYYEIVGYEDPTTIHGVVTEGINNFVERIYSKALGRDSDSSGIDFWSNEIANESWNPVEVASYFIISPEFESKGWDDIEYVKILYRTFMGREYDEEGLNYWLGRLQGESRQRVLDCFAACEEFQDIISSFGL